MRLTVLSKAHVVSITLITRTHLVNHVRPSRMDKVRSSCSHKMYAAYDCAGQCVDISCKRLQPLTTLKQVIRDWHAHLKPLRSCICSPGLVECCGEDKHIGGECTDKLHDLDCARCSSMLALVVVWEWMRDDHTYAWIYGSRYKSN